MNNSDTIFICYRHSKDDNIADRVKDWLERYGYDVYFDKNTYRLGNKGLTERTNQIARCTDFLLFLSKSTFRKRLFFKRRTDWVIKEVETALGQHNLRNKGKVNIILILYPEGVEIPTNIPSEISVISEFPAVHYCNIHDGHYRIFIQDIIAKLNSHPTYIPYGHEIATMTKQYNIEEAIAQNRWKFI